MTTAPQPTEPESQMSPEPKRTPVPQAADFVVHVPTVSNANDYPFLPGHSIVRHVSEVSDTPGDLAYIVRLQSGERETVSNV